MKNKLKKIFSLKFYTYNYKKYKELINYDLLFNLKFRKMSKATFSFNRSYEWRYIKLYRKYQANKDNIFGFFYRIKLGHFSNKTGVDFEFNPNFGKGIIIGHFGKIVINKSVTFGNEVFLTHGVTIGRDVRGKRAGVPTIGNRVCIRTNSSVCGKITIGDDVLIAPNTFVNFDVPSHSIVIGNPATIHHRDNATEGHIPTLKDK